MLPGILLRRSLQITANAKLVLVMLATTKSKKSVLRPFPDSSSVTPGIDMRTVLMLVQKGFKPGIYVLFTQQSRCLALNLRSAERSLELEGRIRIRSRCASCSKVEELSR